MMSNSIKVAVAAILYATMSNVAGGTGPLLNVERNGTNILLNFAGRLQVAGRVDGPYLDLADARSPKIYPTTNSAQFWRSRFAREGTISAGHGYSAALKSDGTLWTWGENDSGQLGTGGSYLQIGEPQRVGTDADWLGIACGVYHAAALKHDGTLWEWGASRPSTPARVGIESNWTMVSCGAYHTIALRSGGGLWGWGLNHRGQLGIGTFESTNQPTQVGFETNWNAIACGFYFTMALKNDGSLWAWGNNREADAGFGGQFVNTNRPVQLGQAYDWRYVTCGFKPGGIIRVEGYAMALKRNGTLWGVGYNRYGQLGNGTLDDTNQLVQVGTDTDWAHVTCGDSHTIGLKSNGSLWAWGRNLSGQLGDGTFTNRPLPVQIGTNVNWIGMACGRFHTTAFRSDGTLWGWGSNASGQTGTGVSSNAPTQAGVQDNWGQ